jgi:hypothetical protein
MLRFSSPLEILQMPRELPKYAVKFGLLNGVPDRSCSGLKVKAIYEFCFEDNKFESYQFLSLSYGILHILASHLFCQYACSRAYSYACAIPVTRTSNFVAPLLE